MLKHNLAYYEDDNNDEVVDLGISMGKLRLNGRVGGFVRPRFHEEVSKADKFFHFLLKVLSACFLFQEHTYRRHF
jgi:hypothetical protein